MTSRFKSACRNCGRTSTHTAQVAWTCRHCGASNPGPKMLADLAKEPDVGKRRRIRRREDYAAAQQRGSEVVSNGASPSSTPAPAPVRRKASSKPPAPEPAAAMVSEESSDQAVDVAGETAAPAPVKRGLFDRLMYGGAD